MAEQIRNVMTRSPRVFDASDTVATAARCMAQDDIGDVIVVKGGTVCGIVTDRDITIRVTAEGRDPDTTTLGQVCSRELVTVAPTDPVDDAVQLMRERAIRRLPVLENGKPVGIVSLGDLALEKDRDSALAQISAAPANH